MPIRWSILVSLSLGFLAAECFSSPPALVITSGGYQLLTTGDGGFATLQPVDRIIDLRGNGDPDEPDAPDPEPDTPDLELTRKAKGWAESIGDPQTAQAMELVYLQVADVVKKGDLTLETGPTAVRMGTDIVLSRAGKTEQWKPFRDAAGDELTERLQRGSINSPATLESFLRAVAMGLQLSADGSDAVPTAKMLQIAIEVNQAIDGARE